MPRRFGYAMLTRPNKAETAVHGYHCPGDMAVRMREVLARSWAFSSSEPTILLVSTPEPVKGLELRPLGTMMDRSVGARVSLSNVFETCLLQSCRNVADKNATSDSNVEHLFAVLNQMLLCSTLRSFDRNSNALTTTPPWLYNEDRPPLPPLPTPLNLCELSNWSFMPYFAVLSIEF